MLNHASTKAISPMTISTIPTIHGLTTGRARLSDSARYWKNVKMVNPKAISDVLVRIQAINVRSLASRVRCTASRVDTSSSAIVPPFDAQDKPVDGGSGRSRLLPLCERALLYATHRGGPVQTRTLAVRGC